MHKKHRLSGVRGSRGNSLARNHPLRLEESRKLACLVGLCERMSRAKSTTKHQVLDVVRSQEGLDNLEQSMDFEQADRWLKPS